MAAGDGGYTLPIMTAAEYEPPLKMSGVEKWVTAADTRVRYFQAGSGPPLILLHGLGEAAVIWYTNVDPLARGYTVYVPDLPGHGASDEPPWQYSLEGSVHFLEEFMNALGLQRASLVGNSLGGLIALALALEHPQRVRRLVLEDAAGLGREVAGFLRIMSVPMLGEFLVSHRPDATQWVLRRVLHNRAHVTDRLVSLIHEERSRPGNSAAMLKMLRAGVSLLGIKPSINLTPRLGELQVPTMVFWGSEDRIFPLAHGQRAARLMPEGRLRIFEKCGHWPHLEVSQVFNRALLDFLA